VSVRYLTEVAGTEEDVQAQWNEAQTDDRRLRRTTRGIHKDDLAFDLGEHPIKRFGSQGQQKSFLIALRLSQLAYIEKATGVKPILLLDDIFDKIDDKRVQALMQWVTAGEFGQVFITDTHLGRIPALFRKTGADVCVYEVSGGTVKLLEAESNALPSVHGAQ
jgi:DNA replication and repair protein RecF